jgi:hypothetical protein
MVDGATADSRASTKSPDIGTGMMIDSNSIKRVEPTVGKSPISLEECKEYTSNYRRRTERW